MRCRRGNWWPAVLAWPIVSCRLRERHLNPAASQRRARGAVVFLACARDVDLLGLRERRTDADGEQDGGQNQLAVTCVEAFGSPGTPAFKWGRTTVASNGRFPGNREGRSDFAGPMSESSGRRWPIERLGYSSAHDHITGPACPASMDSRPWGCRGCRFCGSVPGSSRTV